MRVRPNIRLRRRTLRTIELILAAAGLAALGYCVVSLIGTWYFQKRQAYNFDQELRRQKAFSPGPPKAKPFPPVRPPREGSVIGRIQAARLGLSAMIVEGDRASDLARAVGHIPGTALPGEVGNVGLAGHRDTFFRSLRNIRTDDIIELVTTQGTVRYRVTATRVVTPDDVAVLRPTLRESLTLVTCYPFDYIGPAPDRFIVRAERRSST